MKFCSNCGSNLDEKILKFCPNCGKEIILLKNTTINNNENTINNSLESKNNENISNSNYVLECNYFMCRFIFDNKVGFIRTNMLGGNQILASIDQIKAIKDFSENDIKVIKFISYVPLLMLFSIFMLMYEFFSSLLNREYPSFFWLYLIIIFTIAFIFFIIKYSTRIILKDGTSKFVVQNILLPGKRTRQFYDFLIFIRKINNYLKNGNIEAIDNLNTPKINIGSPSINNNENLNSSNRTPYYLIQNNSNHMILNVIAAVVIVIVLFYFYDAFYGNVSYNDCSNKSSLSSNIKCERYKKQVQENIDSAANTIQNLFGR